MYGIYPELGLLYPPREPSIPAEEKGRAFARWVSAYYSPVPKGVAIAPESLQARVELSDLTPTLCALSKSELEDMTEPSAVLRSGAILQTAGEIHQQNVHRAFLQPDLVLPSVDVVALWCDKSVWVCLWAVKFLQELLEQGSAAGKANRQVQFLEVKNANHFVRYQLLILRLSFPESVLQYHWDEPEQFVRLLSELL